MKFYKIPLVIGIGFWLTLVLSCDNKQEPKKTVVTPPLVVSKAIAIKDSAKEIQIQSETKSEAQTAIVSQLAKGPTQPIKSTDNTMAKPVSPGISEGVAKTEMEPSASQATPVTEEQVKRELVLAGVGNNAISGQAREYDSKGRVDPFIPLLSDKPSPVDPGMGVQRPKRILTPLEKMDLSQIKLVAVVRLKGRSIAMVEETSGKGYEVVVGTYMGKNGGQVSAINPNGVVIKEYVKDYKGKRQERFQEIKFHKENGE